jgi:hypothetical protein
MRWVDAHFGVRPSAHFEVRRRLLPFGDGVSQKTNISLIWLAIPV